VRTLSVSADYFRVLRVHPVLGQVFDRADERPDARVALVSERIWRKYLGGGADATARPLTLDGISYRIAAVLPEAFDDPLESGIDVWMPLNLQPGRPNSWSNFYLSAIARLKPGATIERAQAELAVRSALGCSSARLVRQLLLESLLLSVAGGIAGLLLARVATGTLIAPAPAAVARAGGGTLERAVFAFSAVIAVRDATMIRGCARASIASSLRGSARCRASARQRRFRGCRLPAATTAGTRAAPIGRRRRAASRRSSA